MTALADIRGASHLALDVADLGASIEFYRRVLGMRILVDATDDPVQPNVKGMVGDFLIELAQLPATAVGTAIAAARLTLPGPSFALTVRDAHAAFARLQAEGLVAVDAPACPLGVVYFSFRDPDNHAIELIEMPDGVPSLGAMITAHVDAQ
jgi:catechol 2,3-dioxygenase-like lactoylglutathione lyase family enzyme